MSDDLPEPTRYFTPKEANALLPEVAEKVEQLQAEISNAQRLFGALPYVYGSQERDDKLRTFEAVEARVEDLVCEIEALGAEVRGFEPVLVDFPALLRGEEVFLCWKQGEPQIEWWHSAHTGFGGRSAIADVTLSEWEWFN